MADDDNEIELMHVQTFGGDPVSEDAAGGFTTYGIALMQNFELLSMYLHNQQVPATEGLMVVEELAALTIANAAIARNSLTGESDVDTMIDEALKSILKRVEWHRRTLNLAMPFMNQGVDLKGPKDGEAKH